MTIAVAIAVGGCSGESSRGAEQGGVSGSEPGANSGTIDDEWPALAVSDLTIDAANEPRDGNGLIAGERARIGLRIAGGQPPYRGVIRSVRIGVMGDDSPPPIDAEFQPQGGVDGQRSAGDQPDDIEIGIHAVLARRSRSGVYQLRATVTDSGGRTATAVSGDVRIIGDDAPVLSPPGQARFVEVVDVAGRRRRSFVRGEPVTIRVALPGARDALIRLLDPSGRGLAETRLPVDAAGAVRFPLTVPRLAQLGAHQILVRGVASAEPGAATEPASLATSGVLQVEGRAWAPAGKLQIDAMAVYGGRDGRAPRAVVLRRGESLTLEARIAGGQKRVSLSVRLSGRAGVVSDEHLGETLIARPSAMTRVYARGTFTVPEKIAIGRYQLQLQAEEGGLVSMRSREVVIR